MPPCPPLLLDVPALCHSVTLVMGVTLVTYVTFVSNIIVMCHWSPNVSRDFLQLTFNDVGRGGEGGGVKKCFLSLRQTALLSAESKKPMHGGGGGDRQRSNNIFSCFESRVHSVCQYMAGESDTHKEKERDGNGKYGNNVF
jgi:hypothetical protein